MERTELERKILLAETGELTPKEAWQVDAALAADPAARAWRDDVRRLQALAGEALPQRAPSPAVMARIRDCAAEQVRATGRVFWFRRPAVEALAGAAALALMVGGWILLNSARQAARVEHVQSLIALVAGTGHPATVTAEAAAGQDEKLRALARQLLALEGFTDEVVSDGDEAPSVPQPTALQDRNTPALLPIGCV